MAKVGCGHVSGCAQFWHAPGPHSKRHAAFSTELLLFILEQIGHEKRKSWRSTKSSKPQTLPKSEEQGASGKWREAVCHLPLGVKNPEKNVNMSWNSGRALAHSHRAQRFGTRPSCVFVDETRRRERPFLRARRGRFFSSFFAWELRGKGTRSGG